MREKTVSMLRLFCAACSFMVVQFCNGSVSALFYPILYQLEIGSWIQPLIWLVSPLFGLLQPFIGSYSDRLTFRMGRRRPIIIVGCVVVLIGYILFYLVSKGDYINHESGVVMTVFAFIFVQFAINLLIPTTRAIVFDLCLPGQETIANNLIAFFMGVGNVISYLFAAFIPDPFIFATILIVLSALPTIVFAREQQWHPKKKMQDIQMKEELIHDNTGLDNEIEKNQENSSGIGETRFINEKTNKIKNKNGILFREEELDVTTVESDYSNKDVEVEDDNFFTPIKKVVLLIWSWRKGGIIAKTAVVYFLSWAAFYGIFPIATSFVADVVYHGSNVYGVDQSKVDDYQMGIRMGCLAMICCNTVCSVFSLFAHKVMNKIGIRTTYFLSQILFVLSFIGLWIPAYYTPKSFLWVVFLCYTGIAFNFATFTSFPFAIVRMNITDVDSGLYSGALNISCVLGQTVSLVFASLISSICGDTKCNPYDQFNVSSVSSSLSRKYSVSQHSPIFLYSFSFISPSLIYTLHNSYAYSYNFGSSNNNSNNNNNTSLITQLINEDFTFNTTHYGANQEGDAESVVKGSGFVRHYLQWEFFVYGLIGIIAAVACLFMRTGKKKKNGTVVKLSGNDSVGSDVESYNNNINININNNNNV